ncbi:MAG: PilZ domain-containing protein [Hydrogenothermaceae bacterium]|nr:PilZ domain-containing protein [Hydrogenothermaceae bacterium]
MDQRETVLKGYEIATNILTETNINAIIFLLLFIILIVITVIVISSISKRSREKYKHLEFKKFSKEKELTENQYKILWEYSVKLGRDPFLAIEFKSPFEKVIDLYISENPNFDEELIKNMRKKLGFDYLPCFAPLTTTKDIELFQGGILKTANGRSVKVTLYDKDEQFMYWVVVDSPITLSSGETVKINFVRKSDAAYVD